MTTRKFAMVASGLTLALAMGACGSADSGDSSNGADGEKSDIKIGFAQQTNEVAYRIKQTESIRDEAEERGYEISITDAQNDTAKQVSDVEDLVSQNLDYLILSPREFEGLTAGILAAKDADIPVILVDREAEGVPGEDFVTFIGSDYIWEGEQAANWIIDNVGDDIGIVELTGTPGASAAADRHQGFTDAVEQHSEINIIASQTAEFSRSDAQEVMENILASNKDAIDAVYAHNDEMALGAALAIESAGLEPGVDIAIVGIDGQKDAFEAVQSGRLSATVFSSPYYGSAVFDVIDALVAGESVDPQITLEGYLVDATNVEEKMDEAY